MVSRLMTMMMKMTMVRAKGKRTTMVNQTVMRMSGQLQPRSRSQWQVARTPLLKKQVPARHPKQVLLRKQSTLQNFFPLLLRRGRSLSTVMRMIPIDGDKDDSNNCYISYIHSVKITLQFLNLILVCKPEDV